MDNKGDMVSSSIIMMPSLGRSFTLGMLYDKHKDELVPGFTLWDKQSVQENTVENSKPSSEFEIITSDSLESKSSMLNVSGSLKASFLSGMIEVGGAAKYINDKKKSHKQSRVTLLYKATTTFKQLLVTQLRTLDSEKIEAIEKGLATHVVTGILYGASAFFVFDSDKLDAHSIEDIKGNMQGLIKKIPAFSMEGNVDIKLTDEEKALADKFSCKFYGDFILDSNPTTFEDAVKIYQKLPQLLGKRDHHVPLKVWMLPLKSLNLAAVEVKRVISAGLQRKAQDALEDFHHLDVLCSDYLDKKVVKTFPKMHKDLAYFRRLCVYFISELQQMLAEKVPSIRAGHDDEKELNRFFEKRHKSPFSYKNLSKWLEDRAREINVIRSCVEMMEGIKVVSKRSELDRVVLSPAVDDVFCFVFTSLETTDSFFQELEDSINLLEAKTEEGLQTSRKVLWCYAEDVISNLRERAKSFHNFAKAKNNNSKMSFLIAAIANEKYKGATVYHYQKNILVSEDFSISDMENITDRITLLQFACVLTLDPDTANCTLIVSNRNKKVTRGTKQNYRHLPTRFDHAPQVLCKEELTGCHYWEVEWSDDGEDVAAAVSYKDVSRKDSHGVFGRNNVSWSLGHLKDPLVWLHTPILFAEHNDVFQECPFPSGGCSRVGVFLDWPAGILSYYKVHGNKVSHLHTFHTRFTQPVYPGFKFWSNGSSAFLPL